MIQLKINDLHVCNKFHTIPFIFFHYVLSNPLKNKRKKNSGELVINRIIDFPKCVSEINKISIIINSNEYIICEHNYMFIDSDSTTNSIHIIFDDIFDEYEKLLKFFHKNLKLNGHKRCFELSTLCNLKCEYCVTRAADKKNITFTDHSVYIDLIDKIEKVIEPEEGAYNISRIMGGETLTCYEHFIDTYKYVKNWNKKNDTIEIFSNLTINVDRFIEDVVKDDEINLDIWTTSDSFDIIDTMRFNTESQIEVNIKAIKDIVKIFESADKNSIMVNIMYINESILDKTIDVLYNLGVRKFKIALDNESYDYNYLRDKIDIIRKKTYLYILKYKDIEFLKDYFYYIIPIDFKIVNGITHDQIFTSSRSFVTSTGGYIKIYD